MNNITLIMARTERASLIICDSFENLIFCKYQENIFLKMRKSVWLRDDTLFERFRCAENRESVLYWRWCENHRSYKNR